MGSRGDNDISIGLVQHVVNRPICCFRGKVLLQWSIHPAICEEMLKTVKKKKKAGAMSVCPPISH